MGFFRFKRLIVAIALWVSYSAIYAQEKTNPEKKGISVKAAIHPFHFVLGIIKFEGEFRKTNGRFAYLVSPEILKGTVRDRPPLELFGPDMPTDKLSGYGLGLQQKFILDPEKAYSPYFSYGAIYRRQLISLEGEGFVPYQKNNLTYYEYGPFSSDIEVNSYIFQVLTGYQTIVDGFLLDGFTGLSYKESLKRGDMAYLRDYDHDSLGNAYSGFMWTIGVKIGFQFR